VEAGLRTYDKYNPFPEELDRQLIDVISDYYFVATSENKKNLEREGKNNGKIYVTGNTVIDALLETASKNYQFQNPALKRINYKKRIILLTAHRRESLDGKLEEVFHAIRKIADEYKDLEIIFPVHLNPKVQKPARRILGQNSRIHLVDPLNYKDMVKVMKQCYIVITDSGGLQEEAPSLNKPVLVIREKTERGEGVTAGTLRLIGTSTDKVYSEIKKLLDDKNLYKKMASAKNPYGDGKASKRIVSSLLKEFQGRLL
jgi:UDP-N-acetylglucosamine 2-epimerase (non-hydrolysing)/UDP-GlcNAc:undecaprenyl-phosphate GlcNAc-1-phosphate transferase